jgi:hypothetical protein
MVEGRDVTFSSIFGTFEVCVLPVKGTYTSYINTLLLSLNITSNGEMHKFGTFFLDLCILVNLINHLYGNFVWTFSIW